MFNGCLKVTTHTNTHTHTHTHTHTYKAQSQPNKTDFYQQILANTSIYRNGLVKARNGSVYKLSSDFNHPTVANDSMYRQNPRFTNLRVFFTVTYISVVMLGLEETLDQSSDRILNE
jgi:hypothetical protein